MGMRQVKKARISHILKGKLFQIPIVKVHVRAYL
jgi:hypothetical protein